MSSSVIIGDFCIYYTIDGEAFQFQNVADIEKLPKDKAKRILEHLNVHFFKLQVSFTFKILLENSPKRKISSLEQLKILKPCQLKLCNITMKMN